MATEQIPPSVYLSYKTFVTVNRRYQVEQAFVRIRKSLEVALMPSHKVHPRTLLEARNPAPANPLEQEQSKED